MTETLKRLHMWVGLFNLTILAVFASTGIAVTFPGTSKPAPEVRTTPYEAPADFTDKQVADDLFERLALPLTRSIPEWAVHRNASHALELTFNTPNGAYLVTVLEPEKVARIERRRNSFGEFMSTVHQTTLVFSAPDLRTRLWALYVDLSIVSLLFMAASGVWLWLSSRPHVWWARVSMAGGAALFVVLWFVTR